MGMRYVYTERQAKDYARKCAEYVYIRNYEGNDSIDGKRRATEEESKLIERAIGAALLTILEWGEDSIKKAVATAEYFAYDDDKAKLKIPEINTFLSIAIPITDYIKERENRGEYHISPEEYYAKNKMEDNEDGESEEDSEDDEYRTVV